MDLIIPSLDYIDNLKKFVNLKYRVFLDANMFSPPLFDEYKEGIDQANLLGFLAEKYTLDNAKRKEVRKVKNDLTTYYKRYYQSLNDIISSPNVSTINQILDECELSKRHCLHVIHTLEYALEGLKNNHETVINDLWRIVKVKKDNRLIVSLTKEIKNTLTKKYQRLQESVDNIKKNLIFKQGCLGNLELYNWIYEIVVTKSKKLGIYKGNLDADEHLLTTAIYTSAKSNEPAHIFSFDRDILVLLMNSYDRIAGNIDTKFARPHVAVHRIGYNGKDELCLRTMEKSKEIEINIVH